MSLIDRWRPVDTVFDAVGSVPKFQTTRDRAFPVGGRIINSFNVMKHAAGHRGLAGPRNCTGGAL